MLDRRSIRRFKSSPVPDDLVEGIVLAGQRAPSACNLQTYTIIWVRSSGQKKRVWNACGVPRSIRRAPVVFVICADVGRLAKVLDHLKADHCLRHGHGVSLKFMSIIDASLAAENMVIAAECFGLGSVFIGSALANKRLIQALNIPRGMLPLMLLCLGYPDENPPIRPRWPQSDILFVDSCRELTEGQIRSFLEHMNSELTKEGYYMKYGRGKPSYTYKDHIRRKTDLNNHRMEDRQIQGTLEKAGYLPNERI